MRYELRNEVDCSNCSVTRLWSPDRVPEGITSLSPSVLLSTQTLHPSSAPSPSPLLPPALSPVTLSPQTDRVDKAIPPSAGRCVNITDAAWV